MNIQIITDVYNISKRIKQIDKNYYIVFNTSKQKFEVHNSNQRGSTYCLTVPYNFLDERTLKLVEATKSENIERILNKIDNENKLKESAEKTCALNQFNEILEDELKKE